MKGIIVHGGAGRLKERKKHREGVKKAALTGWGVLKEGGSALDAVEAAVVIMEDDPVFNCGTGSYLNLRGEAEMDAAVMSSSLEFGAVGAIKDVKNPIKVARKVMEETDHILIVGEGAVRFAKEMGFPSHNPITDERRELWKTGLRAMREKGESPRYFPKMSDIGAKYSVDTVGAVALDCKGSIWVATSTGGITFRLPGRVGDTPLIGAGTYANEFGGVSASGHGEAISKLSLASIAVNFMKRFSAQRAVDETLELAMRAKVSCGLIGINRKGRIGFGHTTKRMSCAYVKDGELVVTI